mmetsp:Transcript_8049/g.10497  ORF Transcript_8049/g.10497 Transcript_8049/m.10497 type:complete len:226 (+) Transcript_8049:275-952(+)
MLSGQVRASIALPGVSTTLRLSVVPATELLLRDGPWSKPLNQVGDIIPAQRGGPLIHLLLLLWTGVVNHAKLGPRVTIGLSCFSCLLLNLWCHRRRASVYESPLVNILEILSLVGHQLVVIITGQNIPLLVKRQTKDLSSSTECASFVLWRDDQVLRDVVLPEATTLYLGDTELDVSFEGARTRFVIKCVGLAQITVILRVVSTGLVPNTLHAGRVEVGQLLRNV